MTRVICPGLASQRVAVAAGGPGIGTASAEDGGWR